jgi:signal transduction histidine kinase
MLKELNASKDRFFSIIAHDLKGPFQGLIGYSDILSQDIDSLSKKEVAEYSKDMNESARQIFKLLENLLDWTRIQRNAIEINLTNQNLRVLVSMCIDILLLQANKKEIKIINNVDDSHVAYVDVNMMNTVIRNLISNAIKFTRIGGKIELSSTKIDDKIELVVSDNGVGIDEEALSKLFRIDVQHTTKGTAEEKGTGLGLILCKEMVEKNGGSLRIESKVNEGTSFYITLESEKE